MRMRCGRFFSRVLPVGVGVGVGLLGLAVALIALPLAASPGTDALARFFSEVATLEARFEQVVLDENLNTIDDSRGTLWIARPGRFRWDYEPPEAVQIVGDGGKVWLHDIELEQVTVRDQAQALGRTPAILLAGDGDLEATYEVVDIGAQGRFDWLNLIPKDPESGFTQVRIGFEGARLRVIELLDTLDQRTRIAFTDLVENAPVADERFEFVPPDGIDIIDQSNPF